LQTETYDRGFYLDELVERGVVRLLELFADVEEVALAPGHHDADQRPVVRPQALQPTETLSCDWDTMNVHLHMHIMNKYLHGFVKTVCEIRRLVLHTADCRTERT